MRVLIESNYNRGANVQWLLLEGYDDRRGAQDQEEAPSLLQRGLLCCYVLLRIQK
jgi:hypothetical protein